MDDYAAKKSKEATDHYANLTPQQKEQFNEEYAIQTAYNMAHSYAPYAVFKANWKAAHGTGLAANNQSTKQVAPSGVDPVTGRRPY